MRDAVCVNEPRARGAKDASHVEGIFKEVILDD
jgi:hypothetical protein